MENMHKKIIKDIFKEFNITSKQDFEILMSYLASAFELEVTDISSDNDNVLKHTDIQKRPSERERNLYNINALSTHFDFIYKTWRDQLYPSLKAIDSPLASKLYDRFVDGGIFLMYIKKAAEKKLRPGEEARIR